MLLFKKEDEKYSKSTTPLSFETKEETSSHNPLWHFVESFIEEDNDAIESPCLYPLELLSKLDGQPLTKIENFTVDMQKTNLVPTSFTKVNLLAKNPIYMITNHFSIKLAADNSGNLNSYSRLQTFNRPGGRI